ncbi:MAG: YicC/YloC family endoribonuclease [Clostridia bacterium]
MKSMTGFGKATAERDGRKISIELKAVNHRYLDLSIKLPKLLNYLEDSVRKALQTNFSRGHIDVYINYENKREDSVKLSLNEGLVREYLQINRQILDKHIVVDDISVTSLLRFPDVLLSEESEDDEKEILILVNEAVLNASNKLNEMRAFEGEKIRLDVLAKITNIEALVEKVKERAPIVVQNYRAKLTEKINDALNGVLIDETRLLNEVAFFTDKASIDEEITRLCSHCHHARELLLSTESVGRSLDFLIQEFNREANTIGSKSNDILVTNYALELKNEIEKIREQIQNVE